MLVLNLHDDFDIRAISAECLADIDDILGATDEGREDHVDAVLDTEPQVLLVFLGESWKVDGGLGKIDTLARRKSAIVHDLDVDVRPIDSGDFEGKHTVIDVDDLSDLGDFGEIDLWSEQELSIAEGRLINSKHSRNRHTCIGRHMPRRTWDRW